MEDVRGSITKNSPSEQLEDNNQTWRIFLRDVMWGGGLI
jgi:hypothetical protein